jgi:hypothetical protein
MGVGWLYQAGPTTATKRKKINQDMFSVGGFDIWLVISWCFISFALFSSTVR